MLSACKSTSITEQGFLPRILLVCGVFLFSVFFSRLAFAGSDTWNGASGTSEWASTGNWAGSSVPGSGDTATFDNAGNGQTTIDLGTGVSVNQIDFTGAPCAAYTIGLGGAGGQSLTLNSGSTISVDASASNAQTVNANISLSGAGNLNLSGSSTSSNAVMGSISGSGVSVVKNGVGSWILSGNNTYDGGTTLTQGTLMINSTTALGVGAFTIENGTTFGSNGSITLSNSNVQTWNGSFTFSGGTLDLGTGGVTMSASPVITVSGGTLTVGGAISGSTFPLTKSGGGTLVLSGSNSYGMGGPGDTTINAGTLQVTRPVALSSYNVPGGVVVNNTGTLSLIVGGSSGQAWSMAEMATLLSSGTFNAGSTLEVEASLEDQIYSSDITIASGLKKTGSYAFTLSGTNTYSGNTTVSAGTLAITSTGALPGWDTSGSYSVASGATLAVHTGVSNDDVVTMLGTTNFASGSAIGFDTTNASRGAPTITNTSQGVLGLTKLGSNTLTTGNNTYTGVTTLTGGTLSVSSIGNGGVAGGLGASSNAASNLVFNGGTLQYTGADASTDRNFTINTGWTATFEITSNNLTISGGAAVTNGAVTKTGNGTLTLSGTNLHTSATRITAGTLSVGASANLGNANPVIFNGGTLEVTGTSMTTFGTHTPTFTATKTVGLDIDNASNNFTVSQQLNQTTGGLTKSGAGTLTLTNVNNTYTGTTTVSAGTLKLSAAVANNISGSETIDLSDASSVLDVTGLEDGKLYLASGQTLKGVGTVTGDLIIGTGSKLSPGSSPGTINTGNTTYGVDGTYEWELDDVDAGAGTGWDLQDITGTLAIDATSGSPFKIVISGAGTDFSNTTSYAWTIATALGGITGFSEDKFTLTDGFVPAHTGTFGIQKSGDNDLQVTYMPLVTDAYWRGDQSSVWNTVASGSNTNWATTAGGGTDLGALPNSGSTIYFTATSGAANFTTTLSQDFSVKGIVFTGTGTDAASNDVTIGGANALTIGTGGVTVQSGSAAHTISSAVTLGSAQSWTNNSSNEFTVSGNITNGANLLTVDGAGHVTISGTFGAGAGGLTKEGNGTLTLSGTNTYTGTTTVNSGTLTTNNLSGGLTLAGTGALALGTDTLTISGVNAYTQGAGTTLNLTADSPSTFGHVVATGADASVAAASTINVTVGGTYMANGTTFKVLDGAGGTNVNVPTTITSNSSIIGFSGSVVNGDLVLTLNRSGGDSAVARGGNANQQAVWNSLQQAGQQGASGDMLNVLSALDNLPSSPELLNALATMTPDVSSGVLIGSQTLNGRLLSTISNRLGGIRNGIPITGLSSGETESGIGVWIQALGNNIHQGERQGIQGFNANGLGTSLGIDKLFGRHFRAGLSGGYGFTNVRAKTPGSPSDGINSWQATLYASYDSIDLNKEPAKNLRGSRGGFRERNQNSWYTDWMLGFTENNYDSRREIWLTPGTHRVAKADHHGQQYSTKLEAGYTFLTPLTCRLETTPFASLQYSYLRFNQYKEHGAGALNLDVEGEGYNELSQALGARFAYPFIMKKRSWTLIPAVKCAWFYDYIGDRFETTASFAGGGPAFSTQGAKPARNGLLLGAEIAFLNKGNMTLTGNYDLELRDEYASSTYYATARFDF